MRGLVLVLALSGCGYELVRPEGVAVPRAGTIADTSPEGQLGLRVAARLRRHASGRPVSASVWGGRVEVGPDAPAAYAADGRSAFYRADVRLVLEEARGGVAVWRTHTRATATWARGPDPLATTTARQLAVGDATEAAADAAWQRYLGQSTP